MDIQLNILLFFQNLRNPILNFIFLVFTISTEATVININYNNYILVYK